MNDSSETYPALALAFVRTVLFTIAFFICSLVLTVMALLAFPISSALVGRIATWWGWMHRILSRFIVGQRVVVEGQWPADARFFAIKHEAMFETVDVLCLFHRPTVAAKKELLDIPLWGRVAARYGVIAVDRGGGASALRAIRAHAKITMAQGRVFVLFPEGTRVKHGEAPPLKPGFAGLYAAFASPVVPIAIDSGRRNPRGRFLRFPGRITYRVGEAIPAGLRRADVEAQVYAAINILNKG